MLAVSMAYHFLPWVEIMDSDYWLTLNQLASHLQLGWTKLYRIDQAGTIIARNVGAQWRFSRVDVWMQEQRVGVSSPKNQAVEQ